MAKHTMDEAVGFRVICGTYGHSVLGFDGLEDENSDAVFLHPTFAHGSHSSKVSSLGCFNGVLVSGSGDAVLKVEEETMGSSKSESLIIAALFP